MNTKADNIQTVDEYISKSDPRVRKILTKIRNIVKDVAPSAVETISYAMPAYKLSGKPLVYFAAFEKHIGFYATPVTHEQFAAELSKYKQGKGSVQFPLDQPIQYDLITTMVGFRVNEISD